MKKSKIASRRVPIDFIRPISRLRVTISNDIVVDTTTAPNTNTSSRIVHTKVEKNVPNDDDKALATAKEETSSKTLLNKNTNVVAVTMLVSEIIVRVVRNGRLLRSFEANI